MESDAIHDGCDRKVLRRAHLHRAPQALIAVPDANVDQLDLAHGHATSVTDRRGVRARNAGRKSVVTPPSMNSLRLMSPAWVETLVSTPSRIQFRSAIPRRQETVRG